MFRIRATPSFACAKEDHNFANPKKHLPGGKWTPWRDSDSVRMPQDFRPQYLKKISLL
jgi:hypothetical protein